MSTTRLSPLPNHHPQPLRKTGVVTGVVTPTAKLEPDNSASPLRGAAGDDRRRSLLYSGVDGDASDGDDEPSEEQGGWLGPILGPL